MFLLHKNHFCYFTLHASFNLNEIDSRRKRFANFIGRIPTYFIISGTLLFINECFHLLPQNIVDRNIDVCFADRIIDRESLQISVGKFIIIITIDNNMDKKRNFKG